MSDHRSKKERLMSRRNVVLAIGVLMAVGAVGAIGAIGAGALVLKFLRPAALGAATVADRLAEHGPGVDARLAGTLADLGLPPTQPGTQIALVAFKAERELRLYAHAGAQTTNTPWRLVKVYPILAASGKAGPKLREGDKQVPEGVYRVESLNPNSRFHLALRVAYPSRDDVVMAKADSRDVNTLGGDIMIHGGAASIGCLAMGDEAIEELFVVSARAGAENIEVVIAPYKPRHGGLAVPDGAPPWLAKRYAHIAARLSEIAGSGQNDGKEPDGHGQTK